MCVLRDHCNASSERRAAQVEINNGAAAIAGDQQAARGMDTRRLQHHLGHASITNTVRYTAMSPEPFKDIRRNPAHRRVTVAALRAILTPSSGLLPAREIWRVK
jgi:hypothetical protein